MLSPVDCVLMSDLLIHLKDRAKTAPLHSALPANPRHWLGADSKAAHVGVCTGRSQVTRHQSYAPQATSAAHSAPSVAAMFVVVLAPHHVESPLSFSSIWTVD